MRYWFLIRMLIGGLLIGLALGATHAFGQTMQDIMPDAPQVQVWIRPAPRPKAFSKTDQWLLSCILASRANDAYSTHYALSHGTHETQLPDAISGNNDAMWSYSIGIVGVQALATYELNRHVHHKLALASEYVHLGYDLAVGIRNYTQALAPQSICESGCHTFGR